MTQTHLLIRRCSGSCF